MRSVRRFAQVGAAATALAVGATVAVLGGPPSGAASAVEPLVHAAVQVTTDVGPTRAHNLPRLAVHPDAPDTMVAVAANANAGTCHVHVTTNGGRSWTTREARPQPREYPSCYRPTFGLYLSADFASDGTLYVLGIASSDSGRGATHPYLASSRDLGMTWETTVIARGAEVEFTDKDGKKVKDLERYSMARMALDPSDPKRVYAAFRYQPAFTPATDVPVRSLVATSADGGRTWSKPADVFDASFPRTDVFGSDLLALVVDRKGVVYGFTKERPLPTPGTERLLMAKSTDRGATWEGSVADQSVAVCRFCLTVPEAAVDRRTGAIYVVFDASDTPSKGEGDRGNHDRNIWFIASTDGGRTWSERLKLNDDQPRTSPASNQRWPGIAVAPNGRIDVAWYDARLDPVFNPASKGTYFGQDELHWDVFATHSTDGGATWAPNVRVSDRTMGKNEGYTMNFNYDQSGPLSLVALKNATHLAWGDSRRGSVAVPVEDVYFTSMVYAADDDRGFGGAAAFSAGAAAGLAAAGLALVVVVLAVRGRRA